MKDIRNSAGVQSRRSRMIEEAPATPLTPVHPANALAAQVHPQNFDLRVESRKKENGCIIACLLPRDGEMSFWFKAGQSLAVKMKTEGREYSRSLPVISLPGEKRIVVYALQAVDGEAYEWFAEESNTLLHGVSFEGNFSYSPLRDGKEIRILTDACGIAAATCIALAADENSRFELVYYDGNGIFPAADFASESKGISVVLSKEMPEITGGKDSIFVCGSEKFCNEIKGRLPAGQRARFLPLGTVSEAPCEKIHVCKVICKGKSYETECREGEKLLRALERAEIPVNARCAEGECGYCRSKLLEGQVRSLTERESRTAADISYGYIHPCSVTAVSDLKLEI